MAAAEVSLDFEAGVDLEERVPQRMEVLDAKLFAQRRDVAAALEGGVAEAVARLLGVVGGDVCPRQVDEVHLGADLATYLQRLPLRRMLTERIEGTTAGAVAEANVA